MVVEGRRGGREGKEGRGAVGGVTVPSTELPWLVGREKRHNAGR